MSESCSETTEIESSDEAVDFEIDSSPIAVMSSLSGQNELSQTLLSGSSKEIDKTTNNDNDEEGEEKEKEDNPPPSRWKEPPTRVVHSPLPLFTKPIQLKEDGNQVTEVEQLLATVGRKLGRQSSGMRPFVEKLVGENWLDTIGALRALTDDEWRELGIPRPLVVAIQKELDTSESTPLSVRSSMTVDEPFEDNNPPKLCDATPQPLCSPTRKTDRYNGNKSSTNDRSSAAEKKAADFESVPAFVAAVGGELGRSAEQMQAITHRLVADNWIDTMEQLCELTDEQWSVLQLPLVFVEAAKRRIRSTTCSSFMSSEDEEEEENDDDLWAAQTSSSPPRVSEVERLLLKAAERLQRPPEDMRTFIETLVLEKGVASLDELRSTSDRVLTEWHLPLRLVSTLRDLAKQEEADAESSHGDGRERTGATNEDKSKDLSVSRVCKNVNASSPHPPPGMFHTPVFQQHPHSVQHSSGIPSWGQPQPPTPKPVVEMPVGEFVTKVGKGIGRSPEEMKPYIQRLVNENWFDSLDALRRLTEEEWKELRLPKRLVEEIKRGMNDPELLDLSDVFYPPPYAAYFPCSVQSAVDQIESEISSSCVGETVRSLLKLMETILSRPYDRSKRRIKKANQNFQKRAGRHPSALRLLEAVGYQDVGDYFLLPVAYVARLTEAHGALAQLALHDRHFSGRRSRGFRFF